MRGIDPTRLAEPGHEEATGHRADQAAEPTVLAVDGFALVTRGRPCLDCDRWVQG